MTNQTEPTIATTGLDMAKDVQTLPLEVLKEGLCERSGGDVEYCDTQCARPCAFGLRAMALTKENALASTPKELPGWQKEMQLTAIKKAQTCQQYINGGHDEATAALLAGYKSTASWNLAKKKYAQHLQDLPPIKNYKEAAAVNRYSVRITQVSGQTARFNLTENGLVTIEAPDIQTDGKAASTLNELRTFLQELTDALAIFEEAEAQRHED